MRKHYKNTTSGLSGMMKIKWTDDKMKIVPGRDKRWTAAAGRGRCQGRRRRVWGASCDFARVPWFQAGHWIILHQTTNLIINLKCGLPLTNHFYAKSNFRGTSFDSESFFYLYIWLNDLKALTTSLCCGQKKTKCLEYYYWRLFLRAFHYDVDKSHLSAHAQNLVQLSQFWS